MAQGSYTHEAHRILVGTYMSVAIWLDVEAADGWLVIVAVVVVNVEVVAFVDVDFVLSFEVVAACVVFTVTAPP